MTKYFSEYIYAIVRTKGSEELSLKEFSVMLDYTPSDSELRQYHRYAPSLSNQYADCLCRVNGSQEIDRSLRELAIAFNKTIDIVKQNNEVVAHSHRYGGWQTILWTYNNDIKFCVDTNFGYGLSSYMSVRFFYKNLQLAPYSNYIRYRYARYSDIIRFTYSYSLNYSSWYNLLTDTMNFYNAITKHQEHEIFNWLTGHLNKLVVGLNDIKNAKDSYRIYLNINLQDVVSGDELVLFKIQKIIGANEFIENIKKLPCEVYPDKYINNIRQILNEFNQQLYDYSCKYKQENDALEFEINQINAINDVKIYDRLISSFGDINSWTSKKDKRIMFKKYIRVRNIIAPTVTTEELKKRYNNIKGNIEHRTKLYRRKDVVESMIKNVNEAILKLKNILIN